MSAESLVQPGADVAFSDEANKVVCVQVTGGSGSGNSWEWPGSQENANVLLGLGVGV